MRNLYTNNKKHSPQKIFFWLGISLVGILILAGGVFLVSKPDNSEELLEKGFQEFENGEFVESIEHLEGVNSSKQNADSLFALATAYYNKKEYDSAIQTYQEMTRKYPENPLGYNGLANVYRDKKDENRASENYRKAIATNPNFVVAYVNYAVMLYDSGKREEARKIIEEGLAQIPDSPELKNIESLVVES